MPLTFNIRHLELKNLHLTGSLSVQELELGTADELVQPAGPVIYDLEVEQQEGGILVQGSLRRHRAASPRRAGGRIRG